VALLPPRGGSSGNRKKQMGDDDLTQSSSIFPFTELDITSFNDKLIVPALIIVTQ
jgi:hypothetical protein